MAIAEMLDKLKQKALHDPKLKEALLATRKEDQPFAAFCRKCRELGYEIYEMDLITAGEEAWPCVEVPTAAGRTPRCWRARMISTNCSLQGWRHKKPTEMDSADGGEDYVIGMLFWL